MHAHTHHVKFVVPIKPVPYRRHRYGRGHAYKTNQAR
jgi:hypothetical protein